MIKYLNYLTIALLPTYLLKVHIFSGATISILDVLLILSICCNLLYVFKASLFKELFSIKTHIKVALLLIVFGFYLSFVINAERDSFINSAGALKSFLFLPILFSLTVSLLVHRKLLSVKKLLFSYLTVSSFMAITGIFYFFFGKLTFDGRLEIFLNSPNSLAMILGPGIIILTAFLRDKKGLSYVFILVLLLFHIFSTIATQSLGCFFSLAVLLLILLFKKTTFVTWSRIHLTLTLSIIFISASLFFLTPFLVKINYEQKTPPSSTDSRIIIYRVSERIASKNLLWGVGPGNFQSHYLSQQKYHLPYPQWAVPHPHNNLLLLITEGGLFVFMGSVLLMMSTPQTKKVPFGTLLVFLLFYFGIHGIVDTTVWKNDLSVIFWLVLGLLIFNRK